MGVEVIAANAATHRTIIVLSGDRNEHFPSDQKHFDSFGLNEEGFAKHA